MSTFEEALKTSLLGVNEAFKLADADLHQEVAAASQALAQLSGGIAVLELITLFENAQGIAYNLTVKSGGSNILHVAQLLVPAKGYPVTLQQPPGKHLKTRQEIGAFLAEMAANPDSPLIQHLAFLMRRAK